MYSETMRLLLSLCLFASACAGESPSILSESSSSGGWRETEATEGWSEETSTTSGGGSTSFMATETGPITGAEEFCSDGVQQPWEPCDDGNPQNNGHYNGCRSDCELGPHCGDGVIDLGWEACDDGNREGGDGCPSDCGVSACGELF